MDGREVLERVVGNVGKVLVGKGEATKLVLVSMVSGGHVLIEDVPGTGKTTMVEGIARSLGLEYKRIQFTPDITASELTGYAVIDIVSGARRIVEGQVMSNIVVADEINRSSPKTQSALLEVMEEGQVTIDGERYGVPEPYMVLATQNPTTMVGTYPLPESQKDRFMMRLRMGYPSEAEEVEILRGIGRVGELEAVVGKEEVAGLRRAVEGIRMVEGVMEYIVKIVRKTREDERVRIGVSPRGTLALQRAVKGLAMLEGREYTEPDDVQALAGVVLGHRIELEGRARMKGETGEGIIREIVKGIKVPGVE